MSKKTWKLTKKNLRSTKNSFSKKDLKSNKNLLAKLVKNTRIYQYSWYRRNSGASTGSQEHDNIQIYNV